MTRKQKRFPTQAQVQKAVELLAALAHPLRLPLLLALSRCGQMSAGELQEMVRGEQSAVSHQLAALRRNDLVTAERDGRRMIYSLADEHVAHIVEDALEHANER